MTNEILTNDVDSTRVLLAIPVSVVLADFRTALTRAGYRVGMATDGIQCLTRIQNFHPEVLVLDIDLLWGGADGVMDVLRGQAGSPPIQVMVIGSRSNRSALYRVARFAVNDFQSKPLSGHQLVRRIAELLELENRELAGHWGNH